MTIFQNHRRNGISARGGGRLRLSWLIGLSAALSASAACAADDLALVGDIPMPDIHMPRVDVDVHVGDDVRPLPPPRIYFRNTYAAMPPARYEREVIEHPAVSPLDVASMLRATGYSLLGSVNRRGWVYTVAVLNPRGDDGRVVIDARTGAIIRFVPAMNVTARFDDELTTIYGPPGPPPPLPPVAAGYENRRGALLDLQRTPRPAVAVPRATQQAAPKVANRTTGAAPAQPQPPALKPTTPAPQVAAAPPKPADSAVAESKPAAATVGVAPASAPAPQLKLWPTQAMPDVQPLE